MAARSRAASSLPAPAQLVLFVFCIFPLLSPAMAAPIQIPDFTQCEVATDTSGSQTLAFNCCLPIPGQDVVTFSFSAFASPTRVRQAAHQVTADYIATYERAYALMKALPDDDPRSFHTQANIHCAFCNYAYRQNGDSSVPLEVHFSWLFLPWHRWYLYFHERILQSLLGDPTFSLVFWNWDDQQAGGNVMPAMFVSSGSSPLYDANRDPSHLPPALVNLASTSTVNSVIVAQNLNAMYLGIVATTTAELFIGGTYVTGTDLTGSTMANAPMGGSLENGVHNAVHDWTGNPSLPLYQDMGTFSTAARDPIFYAHHSNVDRLWDIWKSGLPGGPRTDLSDPDFLNAEFLFYDEGARPVTVTVGDALDNAQLGISYAAGASDQLWINYSPAAATSSSAVPAARALGVSLIGGSPMNGTVFVGARLAAIVTAPAASSFSKAKVLTVQGLRARRDSFSSLRAFVNLPSADSHTDATTAEYLGTFNVIPTASSRKNLMTNVKFEVGASLKRLGLQNETEVVITLAVSGAQTMTIEGLLIEYQ